RVTPDLHVRVHHPLGEPADHLPQHIRARRSQGLLEPGARNRHNVTYVHFAPPSLHLNHFEGARGGRLPSRRHAVLRQDSHISTGYPIHHFRGREHLLRQSLRMTNESFAEYLGVAVRTVACWRKQPGIIPRPAIQETLDAALERAPDRARAQFALLAERRGGRADRADSPGIPDPHASV